MMEKELAVGTSKCKQRPSSAIKYLRESKNKTLLMVQYTGGTTYSDLLNLTRPINEAYAEKWGYDYQLFTGLLIQSELKLLAKDEETLKIAERAPESRAAYNKVMILESVLAESQYKRYDLLLILDSDAIMYDFSRDIAAVLPNDRVMAAHKVHVEDSDATWRVNNGVTLWNLRHRAAKPFSKAWKDACIDRILYKPTFRDSDQTPLHSILRELTEEDRRKLVFAVPGKELGHSHGRLVRHFIRPNCENWTDYAHTMEDRLDGIRRTVNEICSRTVELPNRGNVCSEE